MIESSRAGNTYTGYTTINEGILQFTSGAGMTPFSDIEGGKAVFETTDINNTGLDVSIVSSGTLEIDGGTYTVGDITGSGTVYLLSGDLECSDYSSSLTFVFDGGTLNGNDSLAAGGITPVPEPATWAMLLIASAGVLAFRRVRRRD